jgi:hypothetical protein
MTKNSKLIDIITLVGVLILIAVGIISYFYMSGKNPSEIEIQKTFQTINLFTIHLMAALVMFVHIFTNGKFEIEIILLLILLEIFLIMTFQNAGWVHGRFAVISIPFMFLFIIGVFPKYKIGNTPALIIKYSYTFVAVLPVLLYLFFTQEYKELLESSEKNYFNGFESSRTTYGFMASLAFTSQLIDRKRGWMIFVCLICIGIFFSQNRAAVVTCVIVCFYIFFYDDRIRERCILLFIAGITMPLLMVVLMKVGFRKEHGLFEESHRLILFEKYLEYITDNFLFGSGGDYVPETLVRKGILGSGEAAHNLILETLSGFGIFVTIIWIMLFSYFWKRLHKLGRTYILVMIIFGSFHNGFGLSVLNGGFFIIFVLAVLTSNSFKSGQVPLGNRFRGMQQKVFLPILPPELDKPGFTK